MRHRFKIKFPIHVWINSEKKVSRSRLNIQSCFLQATLSPSTNNDLDKTALSFLDGASEIIIMSHLFLNLAEHHDVGLTIFYNKTTGEQVLPSIGFTNALFLPADHQLAREKNIITVEKIPQTS